MFRKEELMSDDDKQEMLSRRGFLGMGSAALAAAGVLTAADAAAQEQHPYPSKSDRSASAPGPGNSALDAQNPDSFLPPPTDAGGVQTFKYPFGISHKRMQQGGWSREVTMRELAVSKSIAGVDMRLTAGGVRELHWHTAAEWAFMLYGNARITGIDADGKSFVADVGVGDLWYFPSGLPHSIQGLNPDGCEFLLVFDSGGFDEDDTFLLSDWFKHVPKEVLAKNFGASADVFSGIPDPSELYIFKAPVPGPLGPDRLMGAQPVPESFSHKMLAKAPISGKSGTVRITDSSNFPASKTIAAALVELEPGGLREL